MGCFIVPAAEAVAVSIVKKVVSKEVAENNPFLKRLGWLSNMLWGGSALLAFEHFWHGEVVLWFPFLTAMGTPESTQQMFFEICTVGVAMSFFTTLVWAGIVLVANSIEKRGGNAVQDGGVV